MERYVWSINGKVLSEADSLLVRKEENVRFVLVNKTMMHHPMNLHGHFFRVVNRHGDYLPLKHTVDVAPLSKTIIEFAADDQGDWFFHCHVLYHLEAGMVRVVAYQDFQLSAEMRDGDEWLIGGAVTLSKPISLLVQHHSEYGAGAGIQYRF